MAHYLEKLFGTHHPSFVIGKVVTSTGTYYGPTIYQGPYPPNPVTDSITGVLSSGDLWIQTGSTPAINQYIGNAWTSLASDPSGLPLPTFVDLNSAIGNAVANLASDTLVTMDIGNAINVAVANLATIDYVTVALANVAVGNGSVANAVTLDEVTVAIENVVSNLATIAYVTNAIANISVENAVTFVDLASAIGNAVANLASDTLVTMDIGNAVNFAVANLATIDYVTNTFANAVTLIEMDDAIGNAVANLASVTEIANTVTTALAPQVNPSLLTVSTVAYTGIATGSPQAPFNSVQAAVNAANTVATNIPVVIVIAPGTYAENVVISRPLTYLTGTQGYARATVIAGSVTIAPASVTNGEPNSIFGLENLSLTGSSGTVLHITGSETLNLIIRDLYLFTTAGAGLIDDVSVQHRVEMQDTWIEVQSGSGTALMLTNATALLHHITLNSSIGPSYVQNGTTVATIDSSSFTINASNTATEVIAVNDPGVMVLSTSTIETPSANGTGITIAAGATVSTTYTSFDVAAGTGYAVEGIAGSVFVYGGISFAPGTNTKVSNAMGAGIIQLSSTITLA